MGDSYDRVRDHEVVEGRLQKAEILADMDRTWGIWLARNTMQRNKNYPYCFHVLVPEGLDMYNESEWEGRMKALRKALKESDKNLHMLQEETDMKMDKKIGNLQNNINERIDTLDKKLDALMKHLTPPSD